MHGILLGLVIALGAASAVLATLFLFARGRITEKAGELADLEQRLTESQGELQDLRDTRSSQIATLLSMEKREQELREELSSLRQVHETTLTQRNELREAQGRLQSQLEAERKNLQEQRKLLGEAEERLRDTFKALSGEALEQSRKAFLEEAKRQLDHMRTSSGEDFEKREARIAELVKPLREGLSKVDEQLHRVDKLSSNQNAAMREQIDTLRSTQQNLEVETKRLAQALHSPVTRGRWGEFQLRRIVELAGLEEHCDFETQEVLDNAGQSRRPDLVIHLAGERCIFVDAKTPEGLSPDALEAAEDSDRELAFKTIAQTMRNHIKALGAKQYWNMAESPDFTVMFVPEAIFVGALRQDWALFEYGLEQGVIPAGPTTLIALLRSVAMGWRQEQLAENASLISEHGRSLYESMAVMIQHIEKVGKGIGAALKAYNSAVGSLERNVLPKARRLPELGIRMSKDMPVLDPNEGSVRPLQAPEHTPEPDLSEG